MEKFAVIIPDRGDRPEFLHHCKYQMHRQTLQPDKIYYINYKPESDQVDLVPRIRTGIDRAFTDGFDVVYIIENDDYYPDNYFAKNWIGGFDITGIPFTFYYHIFQAKWRSINHATHSSLFCTGLRISMLSGFLWPPDDELSLDKYLWSFAFNNQHISWQWNRPQQSLIGIKHNIGKCAGIAHALAIGYYPNDDPNYTWLRYHIREKSFDFYMDLIKSYGTSGTD